MKQVLFDVGGRPFYDDDLETIQAEAGAALAGLLGGLPLYCILSGCNVSGSVGSYTITPGAVWVGGQVLRFLGASGVSLPAALAAGPVSVLDERTYETGDTKACIQEQYATLQDVATRPGVPVYPAGGLTLSHCLRVLTNEMWDVKWGRLVTANYDQAGLGLPGTVAWGWALCNGQHGTDDLRSRFVVNYDPDNTDYAAVAIKGGATLVTLGVNNLPAHTHGAGLKITDSKGGGEAAFNAALTASPNARGNVITTQSTGSGQAFDNRPPYYVLAARQWVGF